MLESPWQPQWIWFRRGNIRAWVIGEKISGPNLTGFTDTLLILLYLPFALDYRSWRLFSLGNGNDQWTLKRGAFIHCSPIDAEVWLQGSLEPSALDLPRLIYEIFASRDGGWPHVCQRFFFFFLFFLPFFAKRKFFERNFRFLVCLFLCVLLLSFVRNKLLLEESRATYEFLTYWNGCNFKQVEYQSS